MSTPSVVAMSVASPAMSRLLKTAFPRPGRPSGSIQASSENSFQTRLDRPAGLLNENRIITMTGSARYAMARNA